PSTIPHRHCRAVRPHECHGGIAQLQSDVREYRLATIAQPPVGKYRQRLACKCATTLLSRSQQDRGLAVKHRIIRLLAEIVSIKRRGIFSAAARSFDVYPPAPELGPQWALHQQRKLRLRQLLVRTDRCGFLNDSPRINSLAARAAFANKR